jgi:long-chain acyl-CoA synthetase
MAQSFKAPVTMVAHWAEKRPQRVYLRQPNDNGVHERTWRQVWQETGRIANGLKGIGIRSGDRVAIIAKNCAEWFIADFAIQAAGAVSAPVYPTAATATVRHILEHSDARAVFIGQVDDPEAVAAGLPDGIATIGFPNSAMGCTYQWTDWDTSEEPMMAPSAIDPDDLISIIYTSGSTGKPKGVEVSFVKLESSARGAIDVLRVTESDRFFSYLPLAHTFERTVLETCSAYAGATVTFARELDTFTVDLKEAAPTVFVSIPRLWMRFQSGILGQTPKKKLDLLLRISIIKSMVRRTVRKALGFENARLFISGSAPLSPGVIRWFYRAGIPISEGWGMTETCGASTVNYPFRADKIGTIGKPVSGLHMKLSDEGEIIIKGPPVFSRYHEDPATTEATFVDGWLRTGDRATVDKDGFFTITGRVKDLFKTAKGKYVAPVPIESLLALDDHIEQVCVVGSGMPQPVALVVLVDETTKGKTRDVLKAAFEVTLDEVNGQLEKHERLDQIVVVGEPWTIENGLLTPTMKVKRDLIEERYARQLTDLKTDRVVFLQGRARGSEGRTARPP